MGELERRERGEARREREGEEERECDIKLNE